MRQVTVQSITFFDEKIAIIFDQNWFDEDIIMLRQLLLNTIPYHQVKEVTLGADRENIRFVWLAAEFVLNFDFYSQSCWICPQDEISTPKIQSLYDLLMQSHAR
jgi:hypothetical protein